jgi:hypothetical protein
MRRLTGAQRSKAAAPRTPATPSSDPPTMSLVIVVAWATCSAEAMRTAAATSPAARPPSIRPIAYTAHTQRRAAAITGSTNDISCWPNRWYAPRSPGAGAGVRRSRCGSSIRAATALRTHLLAFTVRSHGRGSVPIGRRGVAGGAAVLVGPLSLVSTRVAVAWQGDALERGRGEPLPSVRLPPRRRPAHAGASEFRGHVPGP